MIDIMYMFVYVYLFTRMSSRACTCTYMYMMYMHMYGYYQLMCCFSYYGEEEKNMERKSRSPSFSVYWEDDLECFSSSCNHWMLS